MPEKKYRILFLASWYPNRLKPALGNFVQRHAEAVASRDQVAVLHVCPDSGLREKKYDPEITGREPVFSVVVYYRSKPSLFALTRMIRYFKACRIGYRMIRRHFSGQVHLVHLHVMLPAGLFALYLKLRHRLPLVITEHSTLFQTGLRPWQKMVVRLAGNSASLVCPVSDDLGRSLAKAGVRAPSLTIPNVVDTRVFRPAPHGNRPRKRILHVSTLSDRQKNITGILRVIGRLSEIRNDFELHLVSELPPDEAVEAASRLGLYGRVVFIHSFMPIEKVAEHMRQADVFLLFSRYENLPCVLLEAMASGIPVLSTDVGGISEHLLPDFGLLVKDGDENRLLDKLGYMLDHPGAFDRVKMREYAVAQFSRESIALKFHRAYAAILEVS